MDSATEQVVDFVVFQRGQVSGELEKEACQYLLLRLMELIPHELFDGFCTDRHSGIRAMMQKEPFKSVLAHYFDVWHLAKTLMKVFQATCRLKVLADWKVSIVNHFWACCRNCKGDGKLLVEEFQSFLFHIQNVHQFEGSKLTACRHKPITPEKERKKKWLIPGKHVKELKAIEKLVNDKKFCADIQHAARFVHTGVVERLNNQSMKYQQKYCSFGHRAMVCRRALACLEQNNKLRHPSDVVALDDIYVKQSGRRTLRKRYRKRADDWRRHLHESIIAALVFPHQFHYDENSVKKLLYEKPIPKNISKKPPMTPEERARNLMSRLHDCGVVDEEAEDSE
ncbi:uncharacterized protein LOC132197115 [Neocloeon triangulifer]|uniref:uncharacterized protein LOC132197115 n=1 Tax=Neocloeon triangulifer TaxID=2078957 RepID=UPI00286EED75|nr:uncharacterized protein LOC132197115 [Neocloeon triangulifer]